jgi:hypothetical protein
MNRISLFRTRIVIEDNPNMYRDIVLIDGDMDFIYSKTITKDSFIE